MFRCGARKTEVLVSFSDLDDALDVAVTLGVVQRAQFGRSFSVLVVGFEDATSALTLPTDDAAHDGRSLCS